MCPQEPPIIPSSLKGNVAVLTITTYEDWLELIGKKTRYMIRKAQRCGVSVKLCRPNKEIAKGIWGIYNETPIRQNRKFSHYGILLEDVERSVLASPNLFFCAYLDNSLIGFIQLQVNDSTGNISQILSLMKHFDKAVNNLLLSEVVKYCTTNSIYYLVYARFGNHPSLDEFKKSNGFRSYYVAGHVGVKDLVPVRLKLAVIPIYNFFSRLSVRAKLKTSKRRLD